MAKGAIATGVGVILLVGGGGTLATWNQASNVSMGEVVSGDLNLEPGAGVWTNAAGTEIPVISQYKVVPGDALTYTQPLNVSLKGDLMAAKLTVALPDSYAQYAEYGTVSATTLTKAGSAEVLPEILKPANAGKVNASTTFTFNVDTPDRIGTNASADLGEISYKLEQQAPASTLQP
ncbi:alternate-type signal peptide domain-containing protein [Arthrobacter sp. H35-D1]|uniref:alternate-type signal peptide domain-containing protein n=1 Tax=Arthrobacter sp. H35-D1 TaxID=3046202 RepID=UPI0024BBE36B|nr:alternate-type signal peptide domain-containing protein [Arthrobacter sp. H35-D1]MDJ0313999.1 alternate-type signal peptide domain-containing protein [Arthrobacter sp. H35-D1]